MIPKANIYVVETNDGEILKEIKDEKSYRIVSSEEFQTSFPTQQERSLMPLSERDPTKMDKENHEKNKNCISGEKETTSEKIKLKFFPKNLLIFLKHFLIPHSFVVLLTILVLILQNLSGKGCFLPPNCLCNNEIPWKVRDAIKDYFFFYIYLVLMCVSPDVIKGKMGKGFIFVLMFLFLLAYYLIEDEKMLIDFYIYLFLFFIKFTTEMHWLRHETFKDILRILFKLNIFVLLLYLNYIVYTFFLLGIKQYLLLNLNFEGARIEQFILSLYTFGLTLVLGKVHFRYSEFILSRNPKNKLAIFLSSGFMLSYLIGIPVSNLLNLQVDTIASYFWLLCYSNVLTTNFLKINILKFIWGKVVSFCFQATTSDNEKKMVNKESTKVSKIISKTTLDMMFITTTRPIILFYCKRWMAKYGNAKLFKNCQYEYDEKYFKIELFGLYGMVFMNFMIVLLIFVYSVVTKRKILHLRDNMKIVNIYILFLMHCFYEATLTVFY